MKKIIITLLLVFSCITVNATKPQKDSIALNGKTFSVITEKKEDVNTGFTYEDKQGNVYPIYLSKNNKVYILKTSKKSGKQYKYYLPDSILDIVTNNINNF